MSVIPVADNVFRDESTLGWITCRTWATGGSADPSGFANAGVLNRPIMDVLGNTKYLKVELELIGDAFDEHVIDDAAHAEAIALKVATDLAAWAIPSEKIKTSLSESSGITDNDVETGAAIREAKLLLDLSGETRPPLIQGGTYSNTSELARDVMALYWKTAGNNSALSVSANLGKTIPSGWLSDIPVVSGENESFRIVGNSVCLVKGDENANVLVSGTPSCVYSGESETVLVTLIETEDSDPRVSPNMYSSAVTERKDTVFVEFWYEDIPQETGNVFSKGNVFWKNKTDGAEGSIRYRHSSVFSTAGTEEAELAISDPSNLVFSGTGGRISQVRYRIRVEPGASSLSECSPQAHLPATTDAVLSGNEKFLATNINSTSHVEFDTESVNLYTGNIVVLTNAGAGIPTGLAAGTEYYVIRDESFQKNQIKLAATYEDCFTGTPMNIATTPGGCGFYVACSVLSYTDLVVAEEDIPDLLNSAFITGEQWDTGVPVTVTLPPGNIDSFLPEFFNDAKYYVKELREGWIELYQHEDPQDDTTPLRKISFYTLEEDPAPVGKIKIEFIPGGQSITEVVPSGSALVETEYVEMSDYTIDKASRAIRTNYRWSDYQPVSISSVTTRGYVHTEKGPIREDRTYFACRVNDETTGNYLGMRLCDTPEDAVSGEGMGFLGAKLPTSGTLLVQRANVFVVSEKDEPGMGVGVVANGQERVVSRAIPLFNIMRRNAGVYDEVYNPNGAALRVAGESISSKADCFAPEKIATYNPTTQEFGAWSESIEDSTETGIDCTTGIDSGNNKIIVSKQWAAQTEIVFVSESGSLPGGLEENKSYWVLGSAEVFGDGYKIQVAETSGSIVPVSLSVATGTMTIMSETPDFKKQFGSGTSFRTGYSCFRELGTTTGGKFFGVSGRPDGFFYDVPELEDICDLRNKTLLNGTDLERELRKSLDLLFRGALVSSSYPQRYSDGTVSGISSPVITQVDTIGNPLSSVSIGNVIDKKRRMTAAGTSFFSNDTLDGLRRVWSDSPSEQKESDIVLFGSSLGELSPDPLPNPQGEFPDYLDMSEDDGVGVRQSANFASSAKLGSSVSPNAILDADYTVLKYRSLSEGGSNKLALVSVKVSRAGIASGDFYGADLDDSLREVVFSNKSPEGFAVYSSETVTVGGVDQVFKRELPIEYVSLSNDGKSLVISVNPFSVPKPLSKDVLYYLCEHEDGEGYFYLSTSLSPFGSEETVSYIVDGERSPENGIVLEPVFSGTRIPIRRKTNVSPANNCIFLKQDIPTGSEIRISPNSGDGEFNGMLEGLSDTKTYYAVSGGKELVFGEYWHVIRLANTVEDASLGRYLSLPEDVALTDDLFFLEMATQDTTVSILYPGTLQVLSGDSTRLISGVSVRFSPKGSDTLPKPLSENNVYYLAVTDNGIRFSLTPEDASEGRYVDVLESTPESFVLSPALETVSVSFEESPVILSGGDTSWGNGYPIRLIDPDTAGITYVDEQGATQSLSSIADLRSVSVDSRRFRLVSDIANASMRVFNLDVASENSEPGQVVAVSKSIGISGVVSEVEIEGVTTLMIKLEDTEFRPSPGMKVAVTELPDAVAPETDIDADFHTLPSNLTSGNEYYLSIYRGGGENIYAELHTTYLDAKNKSEGYGNPSTIDISQVLVGTKIQFVGYPSLVSKGTFSEFDIGGVVAPGTPVRVSYYSDSATHYGRNFPIGLSTGRVYYASPTTPGKVSLYDTLRDCVSSESAISLTHASESQVYFLITPTVVFETVSFSSDKRGYSFLVPEEWSVSDYTGTPVRAKSSTGTDFPVVSGVTEGTIFYVSKTGPRKIGLCRSLEASIEAGKSGIVRFDTDGSVINESAYMELIPQPVNSVGDPVSSHSFSTDSVNSNENTVPVTQEWVSGTPVYFSILPSGSLGDIVIGTTYYVVTKRESGTDAWDVFFVENVETARAYEKKTAITSFGQGFAKILPVNRPEKVCSGGRNSVVGNDHHESWIRNTIQTGQNWETGTPVVFSNVGDGLLPQYYTEGNEPNGVGTEIDLPILEIDIDTGSISSSSESYYSQWSSVLSGGEALLLETVGNEIPVGLSANQVYYVSGISSFYEGNVLKQRIKLSSSFHTSLIGMSSNINAVSVGNLAVSSWNAPSDETISLGSGYLDLSENTLKVGNYWPTGVPVRIEPVFGATLPEGLDGNTPYFTSVFSADEIQLMDSLPDFYEQKLGSYLTTNSSSLNGASVAEQTPEECPEILILSPASASAAQVFSQNSSYSTPVIDSLLAGGEVIKIWINGCKNEAGDSRIDRVRFGTREITPPSGYNFFPVENDGAYSFIRMSVPSYPQDSLVEVTVRKTADNGDLMWSPAVLFMYLSSKEPVLFRINPAFVYQGWELGDTFWNSFNGTVKLMFYVPHGYFEDKGVSVKLQHFAVGNTRPLPVSYDTDYVSDYMRTQLRDKSGRFTPFQIISFEYTPPVLEPIDMGSSLESLIMVSEVSLVSNDSLRNELSLNTLSFTNLDKAVTETKALLTLSSLKATTAPAGDVSKDLVFGMSNNDSWARIVIPGYEESVVSITFEDTQSGAKEVRTAYVSKEYWAEISPETLLPVATISIPRRMTSSHTIKAYITGNPDVAIDIPYVDGKSPSVGHSGTISSSGLSEFEFQGSNLDKVNRVYMVNTEVGNAEPSYKKRQEVRILRQDENSLGIVKPPMTYPEGKISTDMTDVKFLLVSNDYGTAECLLEFKGATQQTLSPRVESVSPNFLHGQAYQDGISNAIRCLIGNKIKISGKNLSSVSKVVLHIEDENKFVEGKEPVNSRYEITDIAVSPECVWFDVPEILGVLASTDSREDLRLYVGVVDKYGFDTITAQGVEESPILSLYEDENYNAVPLISSITPEYCNNWERTFVTIYGLNLADAKNVLFGTTYVKGNELTITQGLSGGQDSISFFLEPTKDKGIVSVFISTEYGGVFSLISPPYYYNLRNRCNVSLLTEGSGEMKVVPFEFVDEQVLPQNVNIYDENSNPSGSSVIEVSQNLPTGLAVRVKSLSTYSLPEGLEENGVYYVVNTGMRKVSLRGRNSGLPVTLQTPQSVDASHLSVTSVTADTLTTSDDLASWENGMEISVFGSDVRGLSTSKVYFISDINASNGTFKLKDIGGETITTMNSGASDFGVFPIEGNTFSIVDLPLVTDPQNPTDYVVDWSKETPRYFEQIKMDSSRIQGGSLIVNGAFWGTSRVVALNPFYPPFVGEDTDPLPLTRKTCSVLPNGSSKFAHNGWESAYGSSVDEDLEFILDPSSDPAYFIKLSPSFLDSISRNSKTIELTVGSGSAGFVLEPIDDKQFELFSSDQINPSTNGMVTGENSEWRTGMPVVLGSSLPSPLVSGKVYYNKGNSTNVILSSSNDDDASSLIKPESGGYGFLRLTVTYPELKEEVPYYVEETANGRVILYETLSDALDGNYVRIPIVNDTDFLLSPVAEPLKVSLDSFRFDLETSEMFTGSEFLITGTPVRFEPFSDSDILPEGIVSGKTYFVYRSSNDTVQLFPYWRYSALLGSHVVSLEKSSYTVTMNPDFSGDRILQTTAPGGNIDLSESKIRVSMNNSHSNPEGCAVRIVSDSPVVDQTYMETALNGLDVVFTLQYPKGCGLTDRVVNVPKERGGSVSGKSLRDAYLVRDPKFDCFSLGHPYWESNEYPVVDRETMEAIFDGTSVPESDMENSVIGMVNSSRLCDAVVPGTSTELSVDDTTLVFDEENALMGYDGGVEYVFAYDDFVPQYLRGRDLYISSVSLRLDEVDPESCLITTTFSGAPTGAGFDNEYVSGKITVLWNRLDRTVKFTGLSDKTRLTFRLGIVSVHYAENNNIPDYASSDYSGCFPVGNVWESESGSKRVSLIGEKRVLRTKGYSGTGFGWGPNGGVPSNLFNPDRVIPENSRGFSDVLGFSLTAWVESDQNSEGEHDKFELKYLEPCQQITSGETDLYCGTLDEESMEFLYFAGGADNPAASTPIKPSDGDVRVYYMRNPWKFDLDTREVESVVSEDYVILSSAGSGNDRIGENEYPYLAFNLPLPLPIYDLDITSSVVSNGTVVESADPSFIRINRADFGERISEKTCVARKSDIEDEVVVFDNIENSLPILYPEVSYVGNSVFIVPSLCSTGKRILGRLLVGTGSSGIDCSFELDGKPLKST